MRQKKIKIDFTRVIPFFVMMMMMLLVIMGMPRPVYSQYEFYYSENKVQKGFKWNHVETEHFTIYYYINNERLIKKVAGAAEVAYRKISDYLNVQVKKKIPLIFYNTRLDFELTNIANLGFGSGALAFAESNYYRVVVQGESSFDELARTIVHELGHIFEYEVLGSRSRYIQPPLWVAEGFSEFITGNWEPFSLLTVRDAVLSNRIPQMTKEGQLVTTSGNQRLLYYDFGHMIYEFLDEKEGKRGIKKLLFSLKGGGLFSRGGKNLLRSLDYTPKVFNHEFGKYLRKRFEKFVTKEDPEDYSYIIGPDFPYAQAISFQLSPSGEVLAVLTVNYKAPDYDIVMISMKDGKAIKNITPQPILGPKYDFIKFSGIPSEGSAFTWNKDSDQMVFFARKDWENYLVRIDVMKSEILQKLKLGQIQDPTSPVYHPDPRENKIYFAGQERTLGYLYCIDLDTGKISKLTDGLLFIKAIAISPDGKRIVYSAKTGEYYKLYLATMDDPNLAKQITTGNYNDITPSFSGDSQSVYYSSDQLDSYNIYKIDLQEKMEYRYTDVKTGNFFPLEIPGEKDMVVMSSYYRGGFTLFKKDLSEPQAKQALDFELVDRELLAKKEEEELEEVEYQHKGKYKPFSKLYVKSLPPLEVSIGTDGALFGYSYINLTDLMGDHNLIFQISSYYGYRTYQLFYLNLKRRLQLFTHLFAFKESYYANYLYYNPLDRRNYRTLRETYGGEVGVWYPFNRHYRLEATTSFFKQKENIDDLYIGEDLQYGQYVSGWAVPLRLSLVGQNTWFEGYGPNRGHAFKLSFEKYVKLGSEFIDAYTLEGDFRKYLRLDRSTLLAFRLYGFKSGGKNSLLLWTGGNNTIRSVGFRRFTGNNIFVFNAEFRFPLLYGMPSPLGNLGPLRGVFFFDLGGVWYNGQNFRFLQDGRFALEDAISSYGFGLEFFLMGYPMHLEWVWRTDFRVRSYQGVNFWIGFDF